jgi:hypothetical protein
MAFPQAQDAEKASYLCLRAGPLKDGQGRTSIVGRFGFTLSMHPGLVAL